MTARTEFPKKVKLAAWERAGGRCEKCGAKLFPGKFDFDHAKPDAFGGEATLANCSVLCTACHDTKTFTEDIPRIAKADRVRAKWLGVRPKSKRPLRSRGFEPTRDMP